MCCHASLFNQTGDVKPKSRRNGPVCVMQDFEQLSLVQLIVGLFTRNEREVIADGH